MTTTITSETAELLADTLILHDVEPDEEMTHAAGRGAGHVRAWRIGHGGEAGCIVRREDGGSTATWVQEDEPDDEDIIQVLIGIDPTCLTYDELALARAQVGGAVPAPAADAGEYMLVRVEELYGPATQIDEYRPNGVASRYATLADAEAACREANAGETRLGHNVYSDTVEILAL